MGVGGTQTGGQRIGGSQGQALNREARQRVERALLSGFLKAFPARVHGLLHSALCGCR